MEFKISRLPLRAVVRIKTRGRFLFTRRTAWVLMLSIALQAISLGQSDGKTLFKQNCAACHTATSQKLVGPGLQGINEKRKEDWLLKWIKDSQAFIKSGDPEAKAVFEKYDKQVMNPFNLNDDEIRSILAYIKTPETGAPAVAKTDQAVPAAKSAEGANIHYGWYIAGAVFVALILILFIFIRSIDRLLKERGFDGIRLRVVKIDLARILAKNKKVVALACVALVGLGVKSCWDSLAGIGIAQGYQPAQPINYSHRIHAGENKIACQYCHGGAYKGKTAGIPSANVCMNCHKYIKEGKITGKEEIAKIYQALDYDAEEGKYGDKQNPIKWIRIHNLPDLSYFNHSQHVVVGKVACQQCHGQIQEMDTVKQFAPLTMGWCVDCHRNSEVKMAGNGYYKDLHDALAAKYKGQAITVDKIGGLDCAKCHY
jgi:mono/diheme cytochrome c family protein